jgi:trehalose 6-phosphate synthase/phosphatase
VAFIAPIKDGMNLVAKEYLATKRDKRGVLILSETAGAAEELKDAILVDPHQTQSLVSGLKRALSSPQRDLRQRAHRMQQHIAHFTVHDWAGNFMKALQQPQPAIGKPSPTWQLTPARRRELLADYRQANERLLLFDYDGVLAPLKGKPQDADPSKALLSRLGKLSQQANNRLVIISGRPKETLEQWLGAIPDVTLVAEHGAFIRKAGSKRWQREHSADLSWQAEAKAILEKYTTKTPGATIETKEASLVWHYRRANPYYAHKHLVVLKRLLWRLAKQYPIVIEQGNMILEVRLANVHKGTVALEQLGKQTDFVLAIGDDATDEDMFTSLPAWAYTIKVRRGRTAARFRLKNVAAVLELLARLS